VRREHVFRLRLNDSEHDDLERRATESGMAKADVIRLAMGWRPEGLIHRDLPPARTPAPASASVPPPAPDAEAGPGDRGLDLLMRRIAANRGAP
jgi:hypothetical protein